jgi:hypothetical protein
VAQAARIVVPDVRQPGALAAHLEHLVDLLLVLDDRERDLRIGDREDEFTGRRVLVQGHRNGAERLRREHRRVEARTVFADDHEVLATPEPGRCQAARECFDQLREIAPGQRLPDAVLLLSKGRCLGSRGSVAEQESGESRRIH